MRAAEKYHGGAYGESPWSRKRQVLIFLWGVVWSLLCSWTPKPFSGWRVFWLKVFGAKVKGRCFVHQRARVTHPWNVTLDDFTCIGDGAHLYALGRIFVGASTTVAQEAYICTGTHDFSCLGMPLVTSDIVIGANVFVGAGAFVLPGVSIGEGSVVGARSVVVRNVPPWSIAVGNPAKVVRARAVESR